MQYERITWLPDVLAAAGVEYEIEPGWAERGLGDYKPFVPDAVVWHHDASSKGDSPGVVKYLIDHFATNGANVWIDRAGVWHLIASGRAAHCGNTRPGTTSNERSIGLETDHTVGEAWPPALLASLRRGTAAIFQARNLVPKRALWFHKKISVTGKIDPAGLTQWRERRRVARLMEDIDVEAWLRSLRESDPADRSRDDRPVVSLRRLRRLAGRSRWSRWFSADNRRQTAVVEDALKAEGFSNYRQWQRHLGYSGDDADGVPGEASLRTLGKRNGFVVVPRLTPTAWR